MRTWLLALVVLTLVAARAHAAHYVSDAAEISLDVPDDFERLEPPSSKMLFAFAKTQPDGSKFALNVEQMGGPIGREKLKLVPEALAALPEGAKAEVEAQGLPWRSFTVDVMRTEIPAGDRVVVAIQAQLPLVPEAVSVTIGATKEREEDARAVLRSVVATVDGRSNWLTDEERLQRLKAPAMIAAVVMVIVGAVVAWALVRRRRGRAHTAG